MADDAMLHPKLAASEKNEKYLMAPPIMWVLAWSPSQSHLFSAALKPYVFCLQDQKAAIIVNIAHTYKNLVIL